MMRLYAPAIILFLWAMLAIAFAGFVAFGPIAAVTLIVGTAMSIVESIRIYWRRRRG
jgi:hypothetical protein